MKGGREVGGNGGRVRNVTDMGDRAGNLEREGGEGGGIEHPHWKGVLASLSSCLVAVGYQQ